MGLRASIRWRLWADWAWPYLVRCCSCRSTCGPLTTWNGSPFNGLCCRSGRCFRTTSASAAGWQSSHAAAIRSRILSGRGGAGLGKGWNGAGITSSTVAQANQASPESRSLGYAENALLPLGAYTTFRGQAVDATSILIAYTRTGDANLNGVVNDDDVTVLGTSYAPGVSKPAWALGDFEYNGFVDDDDVTLLGTFYNPAANPPPAPTSAPMATDSRVLRADGEVGGAESDVPHAAASTNDGLKNWCP